MLATMQGSSTNVLECGLRIRCDIQDHKYSGMVSYTLVARIHFLLCVRIRLVRISSYRGVHKFHARRVLPLCLCVQSSVTVRVYLCCRRACYCHNQQCYCKYCYCSVHLTHLNSPPLSFLLNMLTIIFVHLYYVLVVI